MFAELVLVVVRLADEINTTPELTNLDMWNLVAGFLSATFILPILQQPSWSTRLRSLLTFAYSLVVGFITAFVAGDLDAADLIRSVLLVFMMTIATYKGFAQPTGIAASIENATSLSNGRKPPTDQG